MRLIHPIFMTVLLLAPPLGLSAQDEPRELSPIDITFRTFMLQGALNGPYLQLVDANGERMTIQVYATGLSETTYEYTGPNPLVFYEGRQEVARFTVPEGMRELILLFVERNDFKPGEPKFRIFAMRADSASFPLGSYLLINFSDREVAAQIDGERIRLRPGTRRIVELSYKEDTSIAARFAELRDQEWIRSYQVAWYFQPSARNMVFLTRDEGVDGSLRLRTVTDRNFSPKPPEEEGATVEQSGEIR